MDAPQRDEPTAGCRRQPPIARSTVETRVPHFLHSRRRTTFAPCLRLVKTTRSS
jgi:hypothetical protein